MANNASERYDELSLLHGRNRLALSNHQKELLAELKPGDDAALKTFQKELSAEVIEGYKNKPQTRYNKKKIKKFKNIINPLPADTSKKSWWASYVEWLGINDPDTLMFHLHGWFTSVRLFFLRTNRIFRFAGYTSTAFAFVFYTTCVTLGGLSYFIPLGWDIGVVIYETFIRERNARERSLSLLRCGWERFRTVMLEEDDKGNKRIYRMLNDSIWVTINLIGIVFTGGNFIFLGVVLNAVFFNAVINVAGFVFDALNEFVLGCVNYYKFHVLENKIEKITNQQQWAIQADQAFLHDGEAERLQEEINSLMLLKEKIKNKRLDILNGRLRVVISAVLLVVGMILAYFPPTTIAGAAIIGAVLAEVFGSLTMSLGARLFKLAEDELPKLITLVKNYFYPPKAPLVAAPKVLPVQEPLSAPALLFVPEPLTVPDLTTAAIQQALSASSHVENVEPLDLEIVVPKPEHKIPSIIVEPPKPRRLSETLFQPPSLGVITGQETHSLTRDASPQKRRKSQECSQESLLEVPTLIVSY